MKRLAIQILSIMLILTIPEGYGIVKPSFQVEKLVPNPLNVQIKLDEKLSSSAVISTTGGTLYVQAADGTKFTLVFPDGSLLRDEEITMTPVNSVEGLPFSGGLVGGVQITPEGLRLLHPATLSIESPKTVATKGHETIALGYHQNGDGMYLNPSKTMGNVQTLELWHFSGEVSAQGTPGEIQSQYQRIPSNPEDAFIQKVQEYIGRERQSQLLGQDQVSEFGKAMGDFLQEAYDNFIAPTLPIALSDCEAAPASLSKALGWSRQVQLLGFDEKFQSESKKIMETMEQVIVNCYNKEYDQCVSDNDIKHRIKMLGLLRQAALLGIDDRLDQSKIAKCPKMRYKALGQQKEITYSGLICNLEQPFSVNATSAFYAFTIQFSPVSSQAGSFTYSGTWFDVGSVVGSGSYTSKTIDTISAQLNLTATHTTHTEVGDRKGAVLYNIDLVVAGPQECGQK